ncbi:MAG: MBL fold metallo-hydrolase [Caldilineaceae bacterium]
MWFEQIIDQASGCISYMIGSTVSGECLVFDPLWDITPYREMAKQKRSTIRYIIDSHIHADHVSGARRLQAQCGGELLLHHLADANYAATRLAHGDTLTLGEVALQVMHTPGHRPEMMSLLIADRMRSIHPWCILTGDFCLVGDLGRPELAATAADDAEQLFDRSLARLAELEDYVEIYPGRVTGGKTVTTAGFERRFNWLLQLRHAAHFVDEITLQPLRLPANATNIVAINQGQQPLTMGEPTAPALLPAAVVQALAVGVLLLDTRIAARFAAGHMPGSYHVPIDAANFAEWVGRAVSPDQTLLLVNESDAEAKAALHKLAFLGLDRQVKGIVSGGYSALTGLGIVPAQLPRLTAQQLHKRLYGHAQNHTGQSRLQVLDVRQRAAWESEHIAGAHHLYAQALAAQITTLPLSKQRAVAVVCDHGAVASIAASILRHHGYQQVFTVIGGMRAWNAARLPTTENDALDDADLLDELVLPRGWLAHADHVLEQGLEMLQLPIAGNIHGFLPTSPPASTDWISLN